MTNLSRYEGYWYRRLSDKPRRLIELYLPCNCVVCSKILERGHIRFLAGEDELREAKIPEAYNIQFPHARTVWINGVEPPLIFCARDYQLWLNPAHKEA